jgi:peptide/nickel transport system permease protein
VAVSDEPRHASNDLAMAKFILKKLAEGCSVLLIVLAVAFTLFQFAGDPVASMAGQDSSLATRMRIRKELGMDRPVPLQFMRYVTRAVRGDFGMSYQHGRPVMELIGTRLSATLELSLSAGILALIMGVAMGVFVSTRRGGTTSRAVELLTLTGISLPPFVVALALTMLFAVELGWLPAFGRGEVISLWGWDTGLLTASGRKSLVLPVLSLSVFQIALILRLTRTQMMGVLRQDYIRFAVARGLPAIRIHYLHALKNALPPVVTVAGLQVGSIIAFSVVTETIFQWPGVGLLFIQAVTFADFPLIAGYLAVVSMMFLIINFMVDVVVRALDPRFSLKGT